MNKSTKMELKMELLKQLSQMVLKQWDNSLMIKKSENSLRHIQVEQYKEVNLRMIILMDSVSALSGAVQLKKAIGVIQK
jgi:hypothetical protein